MQIWAVPFVWETQISHFLSQWTITDLPLADLQHSAACALLLQQLRYIFMWSFWIEFGALYEIIGAFLVNSSYDIIKEMFLQLKKLHMALK